MNGWSARTVAVGDGVRLGGWRVAGPRLLEDGDGGLLWLPNEPARRTWSGDRLVEAEATGWRLEQDGDAALLRADGGSAEADLIELRGEVARAFRSDRPEPLLVVPAFRPLGAAPELGEYLVGGRVLTGETAAARWPIDQGALSLYRIARLRGGAFWDAAAAHVAAATAERFEAAPGGLVVHDLWGVGETHMRYLADGALLLGAEAERTGDERHARAAQAGAGAIEGLGVESHGGTWYLHDTHEQGRDANDLVLNTQLQAICVLHALGRDVAPALRATEAVLRARAPLGADLAASAAVALADLLGGYGPGRLADRVAGGAHAHAARAAAAGGALRLRSGWIARDASGTPGPAYYLGVNLADLAAVTRNFDAPAAAAALAGGIRYARASGFLRTQLRRRDPLACLVPVALANAGRRADAERAAARVRAAGLPAAVGWPGHEDALWSRLAPGTP